MSHFFSTSEPFHEKGNDDIWFYDFDFLTCKYAEQERRKARGTYSNTCSRSVISFSKRVMVTAKQMQQWQPTCYSRGKVSYKADSQADHEQHYLTEDLVFCSASLLTQAAMLEPSQVRGLCFLHCVTNGLLMQSAD